MYTAERLEDLTIQLDEINYFIKELCNDARMELKKNERSNIEWAKDCLITAKNLARATLKKQYGRYLN